MNEQVLDDTREAARIVALSLSPRRSRAESDELSASLGRYHRETGMMLLVRSVCDGLGLEILAVAESGLVLTGRGDTPFDETAVPAPRRPEDALVLLAVLAAAYPRPDQLETLTLQSFSLEDVQLALDDVLTELRTRHGETFDASAHPEQWRALDAMPRDSAPGRRISRAARVRAQLERLAERRLIVPSARGGYTTTEALRALASRVAERHTREEILDATA